MSYRKKYYIYKSKKGDSGSFEKLIKEHYLKLFRFALSITKGNEQTASDVLQNALVKAFLNIGSFKGESSFTSWLWVIIRNEFISYLRKESFAGNTLFQESIQDAELVDDQKTSEEFVNERQRKENLMKMIDMLPEIHKEIIIMIELSGMTYAQASECLDIPIGSVKSRLSRGKEELGELVKKNMELFE
jgi:RNA polymerase sigma-70 factor, ECF subfamily